MVQVQKELAGCSLGVFSCCEFAADRTLRWALGQQTIASPTSSVGEEIGNWRLLLVASSDGNQSRPRWRIGEVDSKFLPPPITNLGLYLWLGSLNYHP